MLVASLNVTEFTTGYTSPPGEADIRRRQAFELPALLRYAFCSFEIAVVDWHGIVCQIDQRDVAAPAHLAPTAAILIGFLSKEAPRALPENAGMRAIYPPVGLIGIAYHTCCPTYADCGSIPAFSARSAKIAE